MHCPRIELGANAWEALMLPLHQQCLMSLTRRGREFKARASSVARKWCHESPIHVRLQCPAHDAGRSIGP